MFLVYDTLLNRTKDVQGTTIFLETGENAKKMVDSQRRKRRQTTI